MTVMIPSDMKLWKKMRKECMRKKKKKTHMAKKVTNEQEYN